MNEWQNSIKVEKKTENLLNQMNCGHIKNYIQNITAKNTSRMLNRKAQKKKN